MFPVGVYGSCDRHASLSRVFTRHTRGETGELLDGRGRPTPVKLKYCVTAVVSISKC